MNNDTYSFAADLLIRYEGFNPTAVFDVNAYRIGYGSDTITDASGNFKKVKKGDVTTEANARKDLERRLPEFENKVKKQVGPEYWDHLNYKVKAALISLAYNYGSITKQAIKDAIKTGSSEQIANALINSTYNDNKKLSAKVRQALRNRRKKEADIIRSAPDAKKSGGFNKKLLLIPLIIFAAYYINKRK
jgi:GH24 family phage-related lysozyme (muramidase)